MKTQAALQVFAEGFAFTRSITHPYLAESLGPHLWRLHDAPRRRASDAYRNEELIVEGIPPVEADRLARGAAQGGFRLAYFLSEGEPDSAVRAEFKALGYRLNATESLMVHPLDALSRFPEPYPISPVTTPAEAEQLNTAMGRRTLLPEHLSADPPPVRQYAAWDALGSKPIGWVASVGAAGCGWCSSMWVEPPYRRQGVARALLSRMLHDDKAAGAVASVLLASHTGAMLYPLLGYQRLGTLYIYTPRRPVASDAGGVGEGIKV